MSSFEGTNLLGDDYKDYVRDQIIQRQYRLGKNKKTSKDIDWINGKTAYFRVASSVDIRNTSTKVGKYEDQGTPNRPDTTAVQDTTGAASGTIPSGTGEAEIQAVLEQINPSRDNDDSSNTTSAPPKSKNTILVEVPNLIDGVPVGDARRQLLGLSEDFMGNNLAKFLVLHGGSEKALNDSLQKRYGVTDTYSNFSSNMSAYGFKNKDWGFVGMPGVTGVDIKSRNMGSLREASISLRINSAEQLALIDTLYFRLGYSIFLEWGNSSHYDNEGNYKKGAEIDYSLLFDFLDPTNEIKKNPLEFLTLIENAREKSNGNYDALLGKVKNFTWEFDPSGFYTATLEVISWGDIVESLKIDGWYADVKSREQLEADNATGQEFQTITRDNKSALNKFIHEASLPSNVGGMSTTSLFVRFDNYKPTKNTLVAESIKQKTILGLNIPSYKERVEASDFLELSAVLNYDRGKTNSAGKIISGWGLFGPEATPYYYIRFGDLLDFIKEKLSLFTGADLEIPMIDINTDPEKNYCFNPRTNISADPSKVMIRRNPPGLITYTEGFWKSVWNSIGIGGDLKVAKTGVVYNHPIFQGKMSGIHGDVDVTLEDFDTEFNGQLAGNIMNIYLEKEFLYSTADGLRDSTTGKLPLYKFIKEICTAINDSLGGVNQLDVRIKNDQTLEIYDQVPLYGTKAYYYGPGYKYPATLNLYGLPGQSNTEVQEDFSSKTVSSTAGSFVTNFGIKTEITNALASTIAIGAQANNKVVGEDATTFSKWSFGLVDRIYPEKVDSRAKDNEVEVDYEKEELEGLTRKMLLLYGDYQFQYLTNDDGFWKNLGKNLATDQVDNYTVYAFPRINPSQFSSYVQLQKDYFTAYFKFQSRLSSNPNNQIGMIPINLNLEMDGMSGIRIYDQLHVDTSFLPSYYSDTLIQIIKGVSHKFNGNRWITSIDTIAQPKVLFTEFNPNISHSPEDSGDGTNPPDESGTTPENVEVETAQLPNELGYAQPLSQLFTRDYISGGEDAHGSGAYGASRGTTRNHLGVDLFTNPGDTLFAAITGIARATGPYKNPEPKQKPINKGVKIIGTDEFAGMTVYGFYTKALPGILGKKVTAGQPIATAFNMTGPYPGITNHVHFQIGKASGGNVDSEQWLRDNFIVDVGSPGNSNIAAQTPSPLPNPSTKAFQSLVLDLQKIFALNDTYGSNGDPLLKPYTGTFNDDEEGALSELLVWISRVEQTATIQQLDTEDKEAFQEQFTEVSRILQGNAGSIFSDKVIFSPPSSPNWKVKINTDFGL